MTGEQIDQIVQTGIEHHKAGRFMEARKVYQEVLAAQPNHAFALHWLGVLAWQAGETETAIGLIRRAIQLEPQAPDPYNNLGNALRDAGQLDEALASYAKVDELHGDSAIAYTNMAAVYMEQGRADRALECFRKALELKPTMAEARSSYLYTLNFCAGYDAKMLLAEHREWSKWHERPLANQRRPFNNDRNPERRLKIGYVSPDFYNHPVGRFLLPLFAHHDHRQVEIYCYSDVVKPMDPATRELQNGAYRWQNVKGISDAGLAEIIRKDQIDILVDLAQHTAENRLVTFAYKPAPVQVAWLGYPGTTGLEAMDYRLTDPYLDPPGKGDENYTERSIRLPHCFWCYEPLETSVPVNALPASENGYVTFGCMNRFSKVTAASLQLWRRILQAVPNSRLLIYSHIGDHLDAVRRMFTEGGIAPRRVEFVQRKQMPHYLWQYYRIDIGLDTFPHGGGAVTCDTLWMGIPVVTLSGMSAVGRGGASLLSNVGVPELIAHTQEEYLAIAVGLASNFPRLAALRASLRQKMKDSPLMDGKGFARDIEAAYRQMWRTWCAQYPAKSTQGPRQ